MHVSVSHGVTYPLALEHETSACGTKGFASHSPAAHINSQGFGEASAPSPSSNWFVPCDLLKKDLCHLTPTICSHSHPTVSCSLRRNHY
jgi:invasion protein IalB